MAVDCPPTALEVLADGIPDQLKRYRQWVVWGWWHDGKKWTKPLLNPEQPYFEGRRNYAKTNDPRTWTTLDRALKTYHDHKGHVAGIGFVFSENDPFTGIDLDKCRNRETGAFEPWAEQTLADFATYAELSPSGTGVKVIVEAKLPGPGHKHGQREIYDQFRYFTITGHRVGGQRIEARQDQATAFYTNPLFFPPKPKPAESHVERQPVAVDDQRIVEKILHHEKAAKLWAGDTSDYGGDQSTADLALCSWIAFYAGPDPERIADIFRDSGLYRGKWERSDYRERTIDLALSDRNEFFNWPCLSDQECRELYDSGRPPRAEIIEHKPQIIEYKDDSLVTPDTTVTRFTDVAVLPPPAVPAQAVAHPAPPAPASTTGYRFRPLSSQEFAAGRYRLEWLVKGVLVKDQPAILGGPKKSMKTNLLTDLTVSLGSGSPFLGRFEVTKRPTCFISGESGEHTLQETARRVCAAKGLDLAGLDCWWDFRLPKLVSEDLYFVAEGLRQRGIEVVIIDPLYLCLLAGLDGKNAGNLYDMGPLLKLVSDTCLAAGATPILAHHARKNVVNPHDPLDLEDLAFAGVQEFARQWVLVNRRKAYDPGSGRHELWLSAGGSVGHGGMWGVNVDEGRLLEDFTGRTWRADVLDLDELKQQRADQKADKDRQKEREEDDALLAALDGCDAPPSKTGLKSTLGWFPAKFDRVLARLIRGGVLCETPGTVAAGKGANKQAKVITRV